MKALVYRAYGGPEKLRITDVDPPVCEADEVLIRTHASSINSWDWDLLRGRPWIVREGGWRTPVHPILGADVVGVVDQVGDAVTRFQVGDRVYGDLAWDGWGGFAEYTRAPARVLAPLPDSLDDATAAALPQAGVLALQGLRDIGEIKAGQRVLINGGGGGVGTLAIQLARHYGAEVTGVDRPGKHATMRACGAVDVFDPTTDDFSKRGQPWDLILDVVANRGLRVSRRALRPGGTYVIVGGPLRRIFLTWALGKLLPDPQRRRIRILPHQPNADDLQLLANLTQQGILKPVVDRKVDLSGVPDALGALARGEVVGKVVVQTTTASQPFD